VGRILFTIFVIMKILDVISFSGNDLIRKWLPESGKTDYQIKLGSQLVVNQTQEAIFLKEGKVLDVFGPGTHTLSSNNIPLLTRLINLPFNSKSPFFAEIYFVNKATIFDSKFGLFPFNLIEPEFKIPISVTARGSYALKINDSEKLLTSLTGMSLKTDQDTLQNHFRGIITQSVKNSITHIIKEQHISPLGLEIICDEVSQSVKPIVEKTFVSYGMQLELFNIEGIPIDDEDPKVKSILADYQRIMAEDLEERMRLKRRAENVDIFKVERSFDTSEKLAENLGGTEGGSGVLGAMLGLGIATPLANSLGDSIGKGMSDVESPKQNVSENNVTQFYYSSDGKTKVGPITIDIIEQLYNAGSIKENTLVWKTGMLDWRKLSELPESNNFINQGPPDLP